MGRKGKQTKVVMDFSKLAQLSQQEKDKILAKQRKPILDNQKLTFIKPAGSSLGFWTNKPEKYERGGEE